jgi:hypothetical protein
MRITECPPCQMGDHKHHHEVVQAVSEGMMGGSRCLCKGECVERGPRPDPAMDAVAKALARMHARVERSSE